jgi:hypothetical protein
VARARVPFGQRDSEGGGVIEWYPRLGDVPGVTWQKRAEADPRLSGAYAVAVIKRFDGDLGIRWVDAGGEPLGDEWADESPTSLATRGYFDAPPKERLSLALAALEVPGTRADFFETLSYAQRAVEQQTAPDFELLEALLQASIQLVLRDPLAAAGGHEPLDRVGLPLVDLLTLYRREGFLLEAADVDRQIHEMPEEVRPRFIAGSAPLTLLDALEELQ